MAITSVTKTGDDIVYVEDGITKRMSIAGDDVIVSFPLASMDKIINMYRQQSDGHLILTYIDSNGAQQSIDINPSAGGGDMTKAVYDPEDEGAIRLTPRTSSSGAEGTIFYDSDDDHVYVATE